MDQSYSTFRSAGLHGRRCGAMRRTMAARETGCLSCELRLRATCLCLARAAACRWRIQGRKAPGPISLLDPATRAQHLRRTLPLSGILAPRSFSDLEEVSSAPAAASPTLMTPPTLVYSPFLFSSVRTKVYHPILQILCWLQIVLHW